MIRPEINVEILTTGILYNTEWDDKKNKKHINQQTHKFLYLEICPILNLQNQSNPSHIHRYRIE